MLFLVKGPLRHEALWRQWFERAAGLLPAQAVSNAMCASEEAMPEALAACSSLAGAQQAAAGSSSSEGGRGSSGSGKGISRNSTHSGGLTDWVLDAVWRPGGDSQGTAASSSSSGSDILERQHLFDVYVHPHPNYTGGWACLSACILQMQCC